jgi:hypothetical protein
VRRPGAGLSALRTGARIQGSQEFGAFRRRHQRLNGYGSSNSFGFRILNHPQFAVVAKIILVQFARAVWAVAIPVSHGSATVVAHSDVEWIAGNTDYRALMPNPADLVLSV